MQSKENIKPNHTFKIMNIFFFDVFSIQRHHSKQSVLLYGQIINKKLFSIKIC